MVRLVTKFNPLSPKNATKWSQSEALKRVSGNGSEPMEYYHLNLQLTSVLQNVKVSLSSLFELRSSPQFYSKFTLIDHIWFQRKGSETPLYTTSLEAKLRAADEHRSIYHLKSKIQYSGITVFKIQYFIL